MTVQDAPQTRSDLLPLATWLMLFGFGLGASVVIGDASGVSALDNLAILIPYALALWTTGVVLTILRLSLAQLARTRRISNGRN
jgi:hypothetical protein